MFEPITNLSEVYRLMVEAGVPGLPAYSTAHSELAKMQFIGERNRDGKLTTSVGFGPPDEGITQLTVFSSVEEWNSPSLIKSIINQGFTVHKFRALWAKSETEEVTKACLSWGMVSATPLGNENPVLVLTPSLVLTKHKEKQNDPK